MSFTDLDEAEATLGKPVTAMTDTELVTYLKLAVLARRGVALAVDGYPERAVMAGLKRTYGSRAGHIVKWAVHHRTADTLTHSSFARGRKWWTDLIDVEVQRHLREAAVLRQHEQAAHGLTNLADL